VTNSGWQQLRGVPTPEIVRTQAVSADNGGGVLWSGDASEGLELSALGALAWDGRDDRPPGPRYEWVGFNLLCNAAPTPFVLDGDRYYSIDSFHEALKLPEGTDERAVCAMSPSLTARRMARRQRQPAFSYQGARIAVGSADHQALLAAAITAKVDQQSDVQLALSATGSVRLVFPSRGSAAPGLLARVTPLTLMLERWKRARL
jgi:predicted NAD-dependent protein-ADP-ribosyltransferase YbiA (DUF1768 family)